MNLDKKNTLITFVLTVFFVSAVMTLTMSALLILNYLNLKKAEPLENREYKEMITRLDADPGNNPLRERIRDYDYLSRKVFFTSTYQLKKGAVILLVSVIFFIISLNILVRFNRALPHPQKECPGTDDFFHNLASARIFLIFAGITFAAVSVILGMKTKDILSSKNIAAELSGGKAPSEADVQGLLGKSWSGFRGQGGKAVVPFKGIPEVWDAKTGKNILWKVKVSKSGFSSPIILGNKLFLSGGDKKVREVYCFDTSNGKLLWEKAVAGIMGSPKKAPKVTSDTGYAAASMTTDGHRVFAIFATGDLICFDLEGNKIWGINLGVPENHYGHSSSLFAVNNSLLVQYDHSGSRTLFAFDCRTGRTLWKKNRPEAAISWASPIIVQDMIILVTSNSLEAYEIKSGKQLWFKKCMGGEMGPSPAYLDGKVFAANDNASALAVDIKTGKTIWENFDISLPDVASPLPFDKYLVLATSSAFLQFLDVETGKMIKEIEMSEGFYSSPVLVGKKVYVTDMKGATYIYDTSNGIKQDGKNDLGEPVMTTPAFAGNRIFFRGNKHLFCIGETK